MYNNAGNSSISRRYGSRHTTSRQSNQTSSESIRLTPPKPVFVVSGPLSSISSTTQTSLNSAVRKGKWTTETAKNTQTTKTEQSDLKLPFQNLLNHSVSNNEDKSVKQDGTKSTERFASETTVKFYQKPSSITLTPIQNVWNSKALASNETFESKSLNTPNEFPNIDESLPDQINDLKKKKGILNGTKAENTKIASFSSEYPASNTVMSQFTSFRPMHYQPIPPLRAADAEQPIAPNDEASSSSKSSSDFQESSVSNNFQSSNLDQLKTMYTADPALNASTNTLAISTDQSKKISWSFKNKSSIDETARNHQNTPKPVFTFSSSYFELDWLELAETFSKLNVEAALKLFNSAQPEQSYDSTCKPLSYLNFTNQNTQSSTPQQVFNPKNTNYTQNLILNVNILPREKYTTNCMCHVVIPGTIKQETSSSEIRNNLRYDEFKNCFTNSYKSKVPIVRQYNISSSFLNQDAIQKPGTSLPSPIRHLSSGRRGALDEFGNFRPSNIYQQTQNIDITANHQMNYDFSDRHFERLKHKAPSPSQAQPNFGTSNASASSSLYHINSGAAQEPTEETGLDDAEVLCRAVNDEEEIEEFEFPSLNIDRSKLLEISGLNYHQPHFGQSYNPNCINHYSTTYNEGSGFLNDSRGFLDYPKKLLDRTGFFIGQYMPQTNLYNQEEEEVSAAQQDDTQKQTTPPFLDGTNSSRIKMELNPDSIKKTAAPPSSASNSDNFLLINNADVGAAESFNSNIKSIPDPVYTASIEKFLKDTILQTQPVLNSSQSTLKQVDTKEKKEFILSNEVNDTNNSSSSNNRSYLQACTQKKRTTKKSRGNVAFKRPPATTTVASESRNYKSGTFNPQKPQQATAKKTMYNRNSEEKKSWHYSFNNRSNSNSTNNNFYKRDIRHPKSQQTKV